MLRLFLSALAFAGTRAQTSGYDWNGFSASGLGCGSDSGALNVGLGQSLPPGATGLKVKQIAFAIYGTNSLPPFIQLHGSTATPRVSTSSAVQCCGSGCDLAVQVAAAGYSWYNSPCGEAPCGNANKWYYMDFSGTAVGTTEQTGISEATFYNSGGSQIGANMINLGSGSVFFMSYTVIIPSPTPTPSVTKSPVSPSLTSSETGSTSISRSVTASRSIYPTNSRSETASRSPSRSSSADVTDSRTTSRSISDSRAPSVSRTSSASATITSTGVCSDARTYFTGVWSTVVDVTATYHVRHWVNVTHDLTAPAEQFIGANPTCTQTSTTCTCTYTGGDSLNGCTINRYATIVYTYGSPQTTTYTTQSPLCAYFFAAKIFIPSRTPSTSMSVSTTRSRAPSVSVTVSPTVTPYLPWFQGLVGCCHNSLDTSVQALNILTPYPFPNMGINRISFQYWPLTAGTATFTIALMNVAGISFPGATILASKTFSVTSPGSFPTYSQQVATFTDLDPISSYVLGEDVEYALAFYNATPGIIDLVLGVSSLSPYFWNSLMPEATGSFYTVGETDPTTAYWYQSTNIAFVAVGAGSVTSSSPSLSMSITSSSSLSATSLSSPSVTTAESQSTSISSTISSSYSMSATESQITSISSTISSSSSISPTSVVSQSTSASSSPSTDVSPSTSVSGSSSSSLSVSISASRSMTISSIATTSGSTSSTLSQSQSLSLSATAASTPSMSAIASDSPSLSVSITTSLTRSLEVSSSQSGSSSLSTSRSSSSTESMSLSPTPSTTISSSIFPSETLSQTSSLSTSESTTVSRSPSFTSSLSTSESTTVSRSPSFSSRVTPSTSSDKSGSPSVSFSISMSITSSTSVTLSPSPQSFQQVNNISTAMSSTSTPQFMFTAYPTTSPTYSPTQNATLPIIVVDGQATNMTTTNALIGSTLALIIVAVALAAGRYLPTGWAQRFRRMIPQKTIDDFKRDPLGSVTAMVNDPKSILKSIKIPDSVKSITDMVPRELKEKFVPESVQKLIAPSTATVPHVEEDTVDEKIERPSTPEDKPSRRAPSPLPVGELVEHTTEPEKQMETVTGITEDSGVIVETSKETLIRQPSSILQINTEDLAAVRAFLEARGVENKIIS